MELKHRIKKSTGKFSWRNEKPTTREAATVGSKQEQIGFMTVMKKPVRMMETFKV